MLGRSASVAQKKHSTMPATAEYIDSAAAAATSKGYG